MQFGVVLRSNISEHEQKEFQRIEVCLQILAPLNVIHIANVNLCFLASDKDIIVLLVKVETSVKIKIINFGVLAGGEVVDGVDSARNQFLDSG